MLHIFILRLKDGKPVSRNGHFSSEDSDDGTVVLLIDKVSADDAGLYSILAINEDGEARTEAPVTSEFQKRRLFDKYLKLPWYFA